MKRPALFIALGMALAFAMIAGIAIVASNAMAGARLRELGNGDIDVTIALSRPTAVLPIGGSGSRAGDALQQRDLEYEEQLREMVRMAQTAAPATFVPDPTERPIATATKIPATVPKRVVPTVPPTFTPAPQPTEPPREDKRAPEPTHTPQAQQAAPAPTSDDRGGDRKTPEPPSQPSATQPPAPTEDHSGDNGNSGPSPANTPKPDEHSDGGGHGGGSNGGGGGSGGGGSDDSGKNKP